MQFLMELQKFSSEYCKGTVRLMILMNLNQYALYWIVFDVVSKHLQRMSELMSAFVNLVNLYEAKCKQ